MGASLRTMEGGFSPLTNVVERSLMSGYGLTREGFREPGYDMLRAAIGADGDGISFRAAAPLMDKAQVAIDNAPVRVGLSRLTLVADLLSMGLTYPVSDALSITQLEWSKINRTGSAQRSMSPSARTENKLPVVLPTRLPLYLTLDGFQLDIRLLRQSIRVGTPLDTTMADSSIRAVNEAIEDSAINGATTLDGQDLYVAGYSAPGLLNAPNAEAQALTLADWTTVPNGANILSGVQSMITKLQLNKKFGPYTLYVPTAVNIALDSDFKANGDLTIRQRLQQLEAGSDAQGVQQRLRIRVADMLPSNKLVLLQMTNDVIDIVDGIRPMIVPWTSLDGFTVHNLAMAIMIPRVKSDYDGNSGICIGTLS